MFSQIKTNFYLYNNKNKKNISDVSLVKDISVNWKPYMKLTLPG